LLRKKEGARPEAGLPLKHYGRKKELLAGENGLTYLKRPEIDVQNLGRQEFPQSFLEDAEAKGQDARSAHCGEQDGIACLRK